MYMEARSGSVDMDRGSLSDRGRGRSMNEEEGRKMVRARATPAGDQNKRDQSDLWEI